MNLPDDQLRRKSPGWHNTTGLYPDFCQPGRTGWQKKLERALISDYRSLLKHKKAPSSIFTMEAQTVVAEGKGLASSRIRPYRLYLVKRAIISHSTTNWPHTLSSLVEEKDRKTGKDVHTPPSLPPGSIPIPPFVAEMQVNEGKLDVVGDIHGCMDELVALLTRAGYEIAEFDPRMPAPIALHHPEGRKLVLAGDLTDRGPKSDQVLRLAMGLMQGSLGYCVMGNHDWKLVRA